ncbi:hypothetical protein DFH28DRAFT_921560 [Melampsora americana]|nr:hypothetical protein DFH28DRAFT_921560 [Melampsora americana]
MNSTNPLSQLPIDVDIKDFMSRLADEFKNPVEGKSVLDLGDGAVIKVHLYKNIAYEFALSTREVMSCYLFVLNMSFNRGVAGIPCEVRFYEVTNGTGEREMSFKGSIVGRTVFDLKFVNEVLRRE